MSGVCMSRRSLRASQHATLCLNPAEVHADSDRMHGNGLKNRCDHADPQESCFCTWCKTASLGDERHMLLCAATQPVREMYQRPVHDAHNMTHTI